MRGPTSCASPATQVTTARRPFRSVAKRRGASWDMITWVAAVQ